MTRTILRSLFDRLGNTAAKWAACLLAVACASGAWGALTGSGTEDNPYLIQSLTDLKDFRDSVNGGKNYTGEYVKLMADIDLDNEQWTPIGSSADSTTATFAGHFDGNNKTISNLYISEVAETYHGTGFIGALGYSGNKDVSLKNLKIVNADVDGISAGNPTINGIAVAVGGMPYGGTIENVSVENATVHGNRYVAGIVGFVSGTVKSCSVKNVTIVATPDKLSGSYDNGDKAGGICGYTNSHVANVIENNTLSGSIDITAHRDVGGVIGMTQNNTTVAGNTLADTAALSIIVDKVTGSNSSSVNAGWLIGRNADAASSGTDGVSVAEANTISSSATTATTTIKDPVAQIGSENYGTLAAAVYAAEEDDTITVVADPATLTAPEGYVFNTVNDVTTLIKVVAQIGSTKYETLAEAVAAVPADGTETTIQMIANEELSGTVTIPANKNIVLDLNGKTITTAYNGDPSGGRHYYAIDNYGTFTLDDSSNPSTGAIVARGIENFESGTMTINGGTITACDANGGSPLWIVGGNVEFNGGTLLSSAGSKYAVHIEAATVAVNDITVSGSNWNGVFYTVDSNLTVEDADIDIICAYYVFYVDKGSTVTVNGGTYKKTGTNWESMICVGTEPSATVNTNTLTINDGTFELAPPADKQGVNPLILQWNDGGYARIVINGGTIIGTSQNLYKLHSGLQNSPEYAEVYITAGTFYTGKGVTAEVPSGTSATIALGSVLSDKLTDCDGKTYYTVIPPYVAQIGETKYETLAAALADVTKDTPLTWVSEDAWPVATPVYYNGNFYAVAGTTQNGGGALDHAIAQANTDHASSTDVALIYVRPGYTQTAGNEGAGTFLATYNKHQPFASNIIIYGNNASLGGEAWEPSVTGMTRDMSVAIYNLHDGAGIWGQHNTSYTLTVTMENCKNAHEYMVNGSAGSAASIANVTIRNCTFETRNNVVIATTNPGTVVIDACTFTQNNNNYVVNINNKNGGTTTATVSNSTFNGGGTASKGVVRINGEVEGTTMSGTFENLTFNDTSSAVADIQIGHATEAIDNKANASYTVSGTTGVLKVFETGSTTLKNDGETAIVAANNYSGNNKPAVAQIGSTKYTTFAEALSNAQDFDTVVLMADAVLPSQFIFDAEKEITLDLAGHAITSTADDLLRVESGALTVNDSVGGGSVFTDNWTVFCVAGGEVVVNGGKFSATQHNTVYVSKGWITFNGGMVDMGVSSVGQYSGEYIQAYEGLGENAGYTIFAEPLVFDIDPPIYETTAVGVSSTVQLYADREYGTTIAWSSSDTSIATVDGTGLVTFTGAAGSATIYAAAQNGSYATAMVAVGTATVKNVTTGNEYVVLQTAIDDASAGDTLKLIANVSLTDAAYVPYGAEVTIDLDGYDIVNTRTGVAAAQYAIYNDGTLTIKDSKDDGTTGGHVYTTNIATSGNDAVINYGTLVIEGGWFGDSDCDKTNASVINAGRAVASFGSGSATLNGGHYTAIDNFTNEKYSYVLYVNGAEASLIVNSADIYGAMNGVISSYNGGRLVVNDANIVFGRTDYDRYSYRLAYGYYGNIVINGGTWKTQAKARPDDSQEFCDWYKSDAITITGGKFDLQDWTDVYGIAKISGGIFNKVVPAKNLATGCICTDNLDPETKVTYPYTVGTPVAQIGDVKYVTFADAIVAAEALDPEPAIIVLDTTADEPEGWKFVTDTTVVPNVTTLVRVLYYDVWVGGTQIGEGNAADVFGDGKVSYDDATKTLTLNGYTYSGAGYGSSAVYIGDVGGATFNIVVAGANSLTSTAAYGYAIRSVGAGAVTVTGSGSDPSLALTVPSTYDTGYAVSVKGTSATFKDLSMSVTGYLGIVVNGSNTAGDALTIDNCDIVFDGTAIDQVIWVYNPMGDGTVSIENGSSLTGKGVILVYGYGTSAGDANLSITGSTVNLTGATTESASGSSRHAIEVLSNVGDSVLTIDHSTVTVTASNGLHPNGNGPDGINVGSQMSANGKGLAKIDIKNGSVVTAAGNANGVNLFTWGDNSNVNPCGAELSVVDSTLNASATHATGGHYGIVAYAYQKGDTSVVFENSTVNASAPATAGIYLGAGEDFNADVGNLSYEATDSDVTTSGPYGLVVSTVSTDGENTSTMQTVVIDGGRFTCNGLLFVYGDDGANTASVIMSDVTAQIGTTAATEEPVIGAITTGELSIDSGCYTILHTVDLDAFDAAEGDISGGVFNVEVPETACAEGYVTVANTDAETRVAYPYTVVVAVAQIGDDKYATFADAIDAAEAYKTENGDYPVITVLDTTAEQTNPDWKIDGDKLVRKVYVAQIGTTKYESLTEAYSNATSGDTIEMIADDRLSKELVINRSVTITGAVDEDGKPLYTIYGDPTDNYHVDVFIKNASSAIDVTIQNVNISEFGHKYNTSTGNGALYVSRTTHANTHVLVSNVTFSAYNNYAIIAPQGQVEVVDCAIDGYKDPSYGALCTGGVWSGDMFDEVPTSTVSVKRTVIINLDSNMSGTTAYAIDARAGSTFVVEDCTISNVRDGIAAVAGQESGTGSTSVSVSRTTVDAARNALAISGNPKYLANAVIAELTVSSGTYVGAVALPEQYEDYGIIEISGGYFSQYIVEDFCANGYLCTTRPVKDELYQVVPAKTVTYTMGENPPTGAALPAPASFAYPSGDMAEIALVPATCTDGDYTFAGWKVSGEVDAISTLPAGTTVDITLVATWTGVKTVTITESATDVPIKVTDEWIGDNVTPAAGTATTEEIQQALNKEEANGNKAWENYVLGLNGSDPNANVAADAAQGPVSATPITSNIEVPKVDTGFKVEYKLVSVDTNGTTVAEIDTQATPDLKADIASMTSETNVVYYKTVAVITSTTDSNVTVEVPSTNTIGVLKVASAPKTAMIAVPWAALDGDGAISAANLVRTANLTVGDELHYYKNGQFQSWTLGADGTWQSTKNVSDSGMTDGDAASDAKIPRGSAVWLKRQDASKPVYLVGEVGTGTAKTALEGGTEKAPAWNMVASPSVEAVDVTKKVAAVAGDRIVIPTDGAPKNYTYKGGKWGYNKTEEVTINGQVGIRSVRVEVDALESTPGVGFWYLNAGADKDVDWTSEDDQGADAN